MVSPATLTVEPGRDRVFTVTFTRPLPRLNAYIGGQLTWTGGGSACAARSSSARWPWRHRRRSAGSYNVTFGYNGPFTATPRGLVPAAVTPGTVADDPTDGACSLTSPNAQLIPVAVPAGTTYARFSLFDADVNPGADIDMCVFKGQDAGGQQRLWHIGRRGEPPRSGRRQLHRRGSGLGRGRQPRSSCTPGCSAAQTPAI